MYFSFIIPVYNRPDEVDELLDSLTKQTYKQDFEIVIVEDGSKEDSRAVVSKYEDKLQVSYYYKSNSGPGASRNYGMERAKGDYFIILDSDCIIPADYLSIVDRYLSEEYVDCFGGPDAALDSFSDVQKAINYSMTSVLTTGGIRGASERIGKFQPRSFNMGLSKKAFIASGGYGKVHPGEDPDLTIRLWNLGFDTQLFSKAYVYHKRRIDWNKFFVQVNKFGKARPILNQRYPETAKLTYWFPTVFMAGLLLSILMSYYTFAFILCYLFYFFLVFIGCFIKEKNFKISLLALVAIFIQFYGYGLGFLKANCILFLQKKKAEEGLPEMFFK